MEAGGGLERNWKSKSNRSRHDVIVLDVFVVKSQLQRKIKIFLAISIQVKIRPGRILVTKHTLRNYWKQDLIFSSTCRVSVLPVHQLTWSIDFKDRRFVTDWEPSGPLFTAIDTLNRSFVCTEIWWISVQNCGQNKKFCCPKKEDKTKP